MNRVFATGAGLLRSSTVINALGTSNPWNKCLHLGKSLNSGFTPSYVACEKGKTVMWCACGHSGKQPLCDGSHKTKGQGKTPVAFNPPEARQYLMCTCKKTKKEPMCDGSQGGCRSFV